MKIILDTNVFISGLFFSGPPYQILKAWHAGQLKLILSEDIFEEYERVGKIFSEQFPAIDLQPILKLVRSKSLIYTVKSLPVSVSEDPDDDKFLACALSSKCKIIVSGDKHLLKLNGFHEITIIKPREFVNAYLA